MSEFTDAVDEYMGVGDTGLVIPVQAEPEEDNLPKVNVSLPPIDRDKEPNPVGWKIVVLMPEMPKETSGGIILAKHSISAMHAMARMGCVLGIGDLAFSEKRGFPPGYRPIERGDWIAFHENAGMDSWMEDRNGNLVRIKILTESDIGATIEKPDAFMVVL